MQQNIHLFILQYLLIDLSQYAKAMVGQNVRTANENEFPNIVCILIYDPTNTWENNLLCTGTLITPSHVLTAEHCFAPAVEDERIEVTIGSHVQNAQRSYPIWWMSYDQWVESYDIDSDLQFNDILITKIFGLPIQVNACPMSFFYPPSNIDGNQVTMVGCGRMDNHQLPAELRTATIPVLSRWDCIARISTVQNTVIYLDEKYICTYNQPYTLLNKGDSGGPLFSDGVFIGVNVAVCPTLNGELDSNQVNIHLSLYLYQEYISSLTSI